MNKKGFSPLPKIGISCSKANFIKIFVLKIKNRFAENSLSNKRARKICNANFGAGFTLIELLVVISIITVLSTAVSVSVIQYREKSKITKATAEVSKINEAVNLLYNDTGKLPNGCIKDFLIEEEANLNTKKGGLLEKPDTESLNSNCKWSEDDLSGWSGPYFQNSGTLENSLLDSWGNAYYMDFDYYGYSGNSAGGDVGPGCVEKFSDGKEKIHNGIAIVSMGPDKKQYTCDDIVKYVKDCGTQELSICL